MKSIVTVKSDTTVREFPKLMMHKGDKFVALFTDSEIGVVVGETERHKIGYHSENWVMGAFVDFVGEIKLVQD